MNYLRSPHPSAPPPGYCDGEEEVRHFDKFLDDQDFILLCVYMFVGFLVMCGGVYAAFIKSPSAYPYSEVSVVCTEDGRCWDVED